LKTLFGWIVAVVALAIIGGSTLIHGRMTERWGGKDVSAELASAARRLEDGFPDELGDWKLDQVLTMEERLLKKAGAVGHVWRSYKREGSGAVVSTFVVCATPHDASGHTPDRCFPGAGFEIGETEHRSTVQGSQSFSAELFSGTFRKSGQTIRVFWTYHVSKGWVAPQIARIELAAEPVVMKLYVIVEESSLPEGMGDRLGREFLQDLLPVLTERLAPGPAGEATL
jgi:Flp pilus assembly pilin Flp